MQKSVKITMVVSSVILIGCLIWIFDYFFLAIVEDYDSIEEKVVRPMCKSHQKKIYLALVRYQTENGVVPTELETLMKHGYIQEEILYCPKRSVNPTPYQYFPEHFGDANQILISESIQAHGLDDARLKKIEPVVICTRGDGTIIEQNADTLEFNIGDIKKLETVNDSIY